MSAAGSFIPRGQVEHCKTPSCTKDESPCPLVLFVSWLSTVNQVLSQKSGTRGCNQQTKDIVSFMPLPGPSVPFIKGYRGGSRNETGTTASRDICIAISFSQMVYGVLGQQRRGRMICSKQLTKTRHLSYLRTIGGSFQKDLEWNGLVSVSSRK